MPDPLYKEELTVVSSMLQFSIAFGPEKTISSMKRKRQRIPKTKQYDLIAKIYQAQGLMPVNDNGLSDPYVRITLAGASKETHTIQASLNPIWYEPVQLRTALPGDLGLAPKIMLSVFDSDPAPLNLTLLKEATKEFTDTIIARALAPPGSYGRTVHEYYNLPIGAATPQWINLHDPKDARLDVEEDPEDPDAEPSPWGRLLCSFELRPHHAGKEAVERASRGSAAGLSAAAEEEADGGGGSGGGGSGDGPAAAYASLFDSAPLVSLRPRTKKYLVEISLVGCRDMQPREILGIPIDLVAPYVEFEYGDRNVEERVWQTRTAAANPTNIGPAAVQTGPNVNFLETLYLPVELPEQSKLFEPIMGVRVRESSTLIPGISTDPIMGITSINLLHEMPTFKEELRQMKTEREQRAQEAAEEAERKRAAMQSSEFQTDALDASPNETELPELFLTSGASLKTGSRAALLASKKETPTPGLGPRTIDTPETQELLLEEDEGEEEGDVDDEAPRPCDLEDVLDDLPFKMFALSTAAPPPPPSSQPKAWWRQAADKTVDAAMYVNPIKLAPRARKAGLLKMMVRVIEEEGSVDFLQQQPPPPLRKWYAERPCKVRVFVYTAQGLAPRSNGAHPQPFLKVYNVSDRVRTTRNVATAPSLDPEFYASFEVAALLPGQSRLHIEVWDYELLSERLIGETIVDLEDRLFSKQWQEWRDDGCIPKEIRKLSNPANSNSQGFLTCKIEILDRKLAIANPMIPIEPPVLDAYELRIVVWDAVDVQAKDASFFGGGGTSDVFITIQPIGKEVRGAALIPHPSSHTALV